MEKLKSNLLWPKHLFEFSVFSIICMTTSHVAVCTSLTGQMDI